MAAPPLGILLAHRQGRSLAKGRRRRRSRARPGGGSSTGSTLGAVLPVPPHFAPERVGEVWRVPYEARAREAEEWAARHALRPAAEDSARVALVAVDVQNTFCTPGFELFVGGRSGTGAVDDSRRLCEFLYRNLHRVSQIFPTQDTHHAVQIFHRVFLVDSEGNHPQPYEQVTAEDVAAGRWRAGETAAAAL